MKIYSKDRGMEHGKEESTMLLIKSRKETNNGRNRTAKSRKNQKASRKGKLKVLGNTGRGHNQPNEDERRSYLPTPPLGQDMTQGQFLSGV